MGKLSLATGQGFLVLAALDANVNASVGGPPYSTTVVRVSCSGSVYFGPGPLPAAALTYGALGDSGLLGGNYITHDASHTALYAGSWGAEASAVYAEPAARGVVATFPVFTPGSFVLYQQELSAATASARSWGLGVFPTTTAAVPPAYASTLSTTTGNAGFVGSAAGAGGMAGFYSSGTGLVTLWWVEAGVGGVYRDAQVSGTTWSVASSGGAAAFTSWATGSVASDVGLVAVAYDHTGGGLLYAAGASTLHVSCATPVSSSACAFSVKATLEGAMQFRGLAMSPSACGGVRRLRVLGNDTAPLQGADQV
jgi:hypothetical protein